MHGGPGWMRGGLEDAGRTWDDVEDQGEICWVPLLKKYKSKHKNRREGKGDGLERSTREMGDCSRPLRAMSGRRRHTGGPLESGIV